MKCKFIFELPSSPLLSQPPKESEFCDTEYFFKQNVDCGMEWCECVHRIKVKSSTTSAL